MLNSSCFEYKIDKNSIYKNPFEEIKELLQENEKIKLVVLPQYVSYGFQLSKELNDAGLASFDEELKVERDFQNGKRKTKIYISLKRKSDSNEYLMTKEHFYLNIFEQIKHRLEHHDKVRIVAKPGEVGIAFRVAEKLISQGLALYDEEIKLVRNLKAGKGRTQVIISLKKRHASKEKISKNSNSIKRNEIPNQEINRIEVKNNFVRNDFFKEAINLLKTNSKIYLVARGNDVSSAFKISEELIKKGFATYDEESKIERNYKAGKAKVIISLKKKESETQKNQNKEKIVKDLKELIEDNDSIKSEEMKNKIKSSFTRRNSLDIKEFNKYKEKIKIKRNLSTPKKKLKLLIN